MLTRYLEETMAKARYDLVSPGRYVGELAEFGLRVEGENLEATRRALREALELHLLETLRSGAPPAGPPGHPRPLAGTLFRPGPGDVAPPPGGPSPTPEAEEGPELGGVA